MIVYNIPGILMLIGSFGIAFGIGHLAGLTGEGPIMLIAAPVAFLSDLGYRLLRPGGHWFHPERGGSLFWLPVWLFGVVWLVLGTVYTIQARP